MLVNNSMFNFYRENSFAIEFRFRGGWAVVVALVILLSTKVQIKSKSKSKGLWLTIKSKGAKHPLTPKSKFNCKAVFSTEMEH